MFKALKYTKQLEAAGLSREQAETHVQIITEIIEGDVATKADLQVLRSELKHDMVQMESRLVVKLGALVGALLTLAISILAILYPR